MPRLRVLAGPSFKLDELEVIEPNTGSSLHIKSDVFEGDVAVYIKGFPAEDGSIGDSSYFEQEERMNTTWSIQVQGRFLREYSADNVLFGNVFDRSLQLPWGFSAVLSFMQYIDPTLEQDLASQTKPWALSPLIDTMPYLVHTRMDELHKVQPFPPLKAITEDISELPIDGVVNKDDIGDRRTYFRTAENREKVTFGPEDFITTDFCYNYLNFSSDGVVLRLPGGITIDMMRYWDGQPVRFACCERVAPGETVDGNPWGRVFWCVAIEVVEDSDEVQEA